MHLEKRPVLVYLDGSEADLVVTAFGAAIAAELRCRLILSRVVRPQMQPLFVLAEELPHWCRQAPVGLDSTSEAIRRAEDDLGLLEQSIGFDDVSRMVFVSSRPCSRLLSWLATNPVAFVIGASYRRTGLARLIHSDVFDRVAQSGLAQVMTLGFESVGPRPLRHGTATGPRRRRAKCRRSRRLTRP
jgi:hypothetical protein